MTSHLDKPTPFDEGLFRLNSIGPTAGGHIAPTPLKTIPVGLLEDDEHIHPNARNAIETIQRVNSAKLASFESNGDSSIEEAMEEKLESVDSEMKFCFWLHDYNYPLSKKDAQAIVELSNQYSNVITPPLQHGLLRAIVYEKEEAVINAEDEKVFNPDEPDLPRLYRIGVERFLEAAEEYAKPTMAPVPFLPEEEKFVKNLLVDYSEYNGGIDLLCFNFLRRKPTASENMGFLVQLIAHTRRIDYFDMTLKYAVNILHSYAGENDLRSPEDLLLAGLGFDFIGENHWRLQTSPSGDYERHFRLFDRGNMVYRELTQLESDLEKYWPDQTGFSKNAILDAKRDQERTRLEKLVNAEQLELGLRSLRDGIATGKTLQFVKEHNGLSGMIDHFRTVGRVYDRPSTQSSVGDFE